MLLNKSKVSYQFIYGEPKKSWKQTFEKAVNTSETGTWMKLLISICITI